MARQPAGGFAELLQRLRVETGMTQEELAEAAAVSPRTVSDLERGINRTARKDTAGLLARAMGLTGDEREQFLAAARGKAAPDARPAEAGEGQDDSAASNRGWLESAVSGNFVGRQRELGLLREAWSRAAAGHRVLALVGGEPGIGKTALTGELARLVRAEAGLVLYGRWTSMSSLRTRRSVRLLVITRGPARRHCCAGTWVTWPGKSPACARSPRNGSGPAPMSPCRGRGRALPALRVA